MDGNADDGLTDRLPILTNNALLARSRRRSAQVSEPVFLPRFCNIPAIRESMTDQRFQELPTLGARVKSLLWRCSPHRGRRTCAPGPAVVFDNSRSGQEGGKQQHAPLG